MRAGRTGRVVVVLALTVGALASVATSANATSPVVKPGDTYVALGSSFASGPMIPTSPTSPACAPPTTTPRSSPRR